MAAPDQGVIDLERVRLGDGTVAAAMVDRLIYTPRWPALGESCDSATAPSRGRLRDDGAERDLGGGSIRRRARGQFLDRRRPRVR